MRTSGVPMTEVARTTVAEDERKASQAEKPVRATMRGASNGDATLTEWSKDETRGHADLPHLWPPDSSFNSSLPPTPDSGTERVSPLAGIVAAPLKPSRIAIKTKGKILLIDPADILSVEAEGNYVVLHHRSDSYSLREALSSLAEKLKDYGFVRIHRSVLVNSASVEEIFPGTTGEYTLRLAGGKQYVVSRTFKPNLKYLAKSWIGTDAFADD